MRPRGGPPGRESGSDSAVMRSEPRKLNSNRTTNHPLLFLQEFFKHPRQIASITPSSRFVERRIVQLADVDSARTIVELGAGSGGTTRAILAAMSASARLIAIEMNPRFCDVLRRIDDARLVVHCGVAQELRQALLRHGSATADAVISGIPFSTIGHGAASSIIQMIWDMLAPRRTLCRVPDASEGRPAFARAVRHAARRARTAQCATAAGVQLAQGRRPSRVILLGCIADDFTGATDLANMLVRGGMRTVQAIGVPRSLDVAPDADAIVVALKSRTVPAREAVAQSLAALDWLRARGARQFYFKYCSTFDSTDEGNIGPVADALLDALGSSFTIACPAFPANQRTIYQGHLFVGETLLSDRRCATIRSRRCGSRIS